MFEELLTWLIMQDTSGYPNSADIEYGGYTLAGQVADQLYDLLNKAEGPYVKYFLIDLINKLEMGITPWSELIKDMEEFQE